MVFSSLTFIYFFLPILLFVYFIIPNKFKIIVLVLFSLVFYFYGEGKYILVLLLSSIINYYLSKKITNNKKLLVISIILNLIPLLYFKYTMFFIDIVNNVFNANLFIQNIVLPIGISFFTFQNISYLVDSYKDKNEVAKNLLEYILYITFFAQLVAGPIVRFSEIKSDINNRKLNIENLYIGIKRFIIGLAKKLILANNIGILINYLNNLNGSILLYWLLALSYTFQIYFDFSGYSDMAIGLGRMFNFKFLENFNYPLSASSITDFWRKWHISLSRFFKDYVYIPLGGNRVSKIKHIRNILIVWVLTGFWHGASFNFIFWGLYFGILLIIEKYFLTNFLDKHKIFAHIYTFILIIISFVIFSISDINSLVAFIKSMFGLNNLPFVNFDTIYYLKSYLILIIICFVASLPIVKILKFNSNKIINFIEPVIYFSLLFISTAYLVDSTFNPFLYFRF